MCLCTALSNTFVKELQYIGYSMLEVTVVQLVFTQLVHHQSKHASVNMRNTCFFIMVIMGVDVCFVLTAIMNVVEETNTHTPTHTNTAWVQTNV